MTIQSSLRYPMALTAVGALAFSACGGSSDSESTVVSDSTAETTVDTDDTQVDSLPTSEPDTTEPAATDPVVVDEPVSTEGSASGDEDPSDTTSDDGLQDDGLQDDGSMDDFFGDAFLPENVDDSEFCQSYASVFGGLIGVSFTAAFSEMGEEGTSENIAESFELLIYPGIADDVDVVIAGSPPALAPFFEPFAERITAATDALREAGFTDAEIAEIAEVEAGDDSVDTDQFEPRLSDAVATLIASSGTFFEFTDSMDAPTDDATEADAEAFLEAECPLLAATLDNL